MVASSGRKWAIGLVATAALFVAALIVSPDALVFVPAVAVPIWASLLFANKEYNAQSRRYLWTVFLAGLLVFVLVTVAFLLVS